MMPKKKINEGKPLCGYTGGNDIYRKFQYQFSRLLNPNGFPQNEAEFFKTYVHGSPVEDTIKSIISHNDHSLHFFVGYAGIGKTSLIKHCFEVFYSTPKIYRKKCIIIWPSFFNGRAGEDNSHNLTKKLLSVCSEIETEYEIKERFDSNNDRSEYLKFIKQTCPEILENINPNQLRNKSDEEIRELRLNAAWETDKYMFALSMLKFYLQKYCVDIKKLIIIVDDIEALNYKRQISVIRDYLSCYTELKTSIHSDSYNQFGISIVISIRPHVNRLLNGERIIDSFPQNIRITKEDAAPLGMLFTKRFEYFSENNTEAIGNLSTWQACYNALMSITNKFGGKYSRTILNLSHRNIRDALVHYTRVLGNRTWIQNDAIVSPYFTVEPSEYCFNNINVIRALGCNESFYYSSAQDNFIPNLLFTTVDEDYSLLCLLIVKMYIKKQHADIFYGLDYVLISDIERDICNLLSFIPNIKKSVEMSIRYLFDKEVLRKSIDDEDKEQTVENPGVITSESKLYLSLKGIELWDMLGSDSVLLEMYREDIYRETESSITDSSYDLMSVGRQRDIFKDLLYLIEEIFEKEEHILVECKDKKLYGTYENMFGSDLVSKHLWLGVKKSMDYSGVLHKNNDLMIQNDYLINRFESY
jgi:hypothetical protein